MPDFIQLFPGLLLGAIVVLTLVLLPLINANSRQSVHELGHEERDPRSISRSALSSAETQPLRTSHSAETQPIRLTID